MTNTRTPPTCSYGSQIVSFREGFQRCACTKQHSRATGFTEEAEQQPHYTVGAQKKYFEKYSELFGDDPTKLQGNLSRAREVNYRSSRPPHVQAQLLRDREDGNHVSNIGVSHKQEVISLPQSASGVDEKIIKNMQQLLQDDYRSEREGDTSGGHEFKSHLSP